MRKLLIIAAAAMAVCSCDFFRTIAGRPTSADIEMMRQAQLAEEVSRQVRLDSLAELERHLSDSLALIDEIRQTNGVVVRTADLSGETAASLQKRYYIMVGTFSNKDNAMKVASKASAAGCEVTLIDYRSGFTAVGLNGSDNLIDAYNTLQTVREMDFCPKDAWILEND